MATYIALMVLFNISIGYSMAVALGHGSWNPWRQACIERANSAQNCPALPKIDEPLVPLSRAPEVPPSVTQSSVEKTPPEQDSHRALDILRDIQAKLNPLRSFKDKSIARSLSLELRGLVQAQFSLWELSLDELASEDFSEIILQNVALAETTMSNIDRIDWKGSFDEIIDSIDKQLTMFMESLTK